MTASTARAPSSYLPDVEGLRGLAILLVVAYHASLPGVPGGYVGVDVFFVLSGYLIIGQLARELESTGRIDLPAFYARRARRLLPAAGVVFVATLLVSYWMLPPHAAETSARAGIAAAFYFSNFYFAQRSTNYLADESGNPLLHTWSLSVEEQFYLVWPLAFALLVLVAPGIPARRRATWLTVVFVLASFGWAVVQQRLDASWAFFSPLTRAWEFGVGGLVALGARRVASPSRLLIVGGYAGAASVLVASAMYGTRTSIPSWPALLPTLGTALVLWGAGKNSSAAVGRWLGIAPLRWVGRASYSWYLWHWPVGVLTQYYLQRETVDVRIASAIASLVLAEATRRWIENPVRFHPVLVERPRYVLRLAVLMILATGLAGTAAESWASLAKRRYRHTRMAQAEERPGIYHNGCFLDVEEVESPPCMSGDTSSSRTVVLFGDSHAAQWYPALRLAAHERGWKLVSLTKASCPIAWTEGNWSRVREDACVQWRASAMQRILDAKPFVVITSNYEGDVRWDDSDVGRYGASAWRDGLRRSLRILDSAQINTIVLRDTPRPGFDVPACVSSLQRWKRSSPPLCAFDRTTPKSDAVARLLTEAAEGLYRVRIVDLTGAICPEPTCTPVRDDILIWRDRHHLTPAFSRHMSALLARELEPVLSPPNAIASR
jgi:peptidoglycan/LPS O-acetylase OafA/YrhL